MIVGGLTGYERRLKLSLDKNNSKWRPLHEGALFNAGQRRKTKILAKNSWFKKRKPEDDYQTGSPSKKSRTDKAENPEQGAHRSSQPTTRRTHTERRLQRSKPEQARDYTAKKDRGQDDHGGWKEQGQCAHSGGAKKQKPEPDTLAVMFVEQTFGGELAKRLQVVEDRLARMTGYRVRISETSGSQLCRLLPNTNPWSGVDCGSSECYTCSQGGETLEDCKRRNVLYESVCTVCNVEIDNIKKKDIRNMNGVYVGETGRSIHERAKEHQQDAQTHKIESHMYKHWKIEHPELEEQPKFKIKIVASFRDALSRQISESVRIDMRGENVLNSRTEYSRCTIPRLTIDKERWKTRKTEELKEVNQEEDPKIDLVELRGTAWLLGLPAGAPQKRKNEQGGRKPKKRKLEKLENWGEVGGA